MATYSVNCNTLKYVNYVVGSTTNRPYQMKLNTTTTWTAIAQLYCATSGISFYSNSAKTTAISVVQWNSNFYVKTTTARYKIFNPTTSSTYRYMAYWDDFRELNYAVPITAGYFSFNTTRYTTTTVGGQTRDVHFRYTYIVSECESPYYYNNNVKTYCNRYGYGIATPDTILIVGAVYIGEYDNGRVPKGYLVNPNTWTETLMSAFYTGRQYLGEGNYLYYLYPDFSSQSSVSSAHDGWFIHIRDDLGNSRTWFQLDYVGYPD